MKNIKYIILVFATLCLLNCTEKVEIPDPINLLPAITTDGKNTFGCLIDGEPFFVEGLYEPVWISFFSSSSIYYHDIDSPIFEIRAENIESGNTVSLKAADYGVGDYINLYIDNPSYHENKTGIVKGKGNYYKVVPFENSHIKVLRNDEEVFAGTFEFTAKNIDNGSIVKVTDGRFDIEK